MKSMAKMKYHYGLKMRCYPSDQQKRLIKINSDASRFIYNEMVAIGKELMQLRRVKLPIDTVQDRIKQLTMRQNAKQMSNHYQFLEDERIDSLAKANAIQNYRKAWNAFRKVHSAGVPKFHRKSYRWRYQTNCQYPGQKTALLTNGTVCFLDNSHVKVPKIGLLRVAGSQARLLKRMRETRIGTVTLTKDSADRFFLSMQLASDESFVEAPKADHGHIGIDLNTDNFLTDSEGNIVPNPRYYRTIKGKLVKEQRILSRRQRRAKKEHRFLRELRSKNMLKNHALALSISDVGWRSFLGMLAYKADLYGRQFITVSPRNTTQTCHNCGFVMGINGTVKLTLADRKWTCPNCGTHHIRDWNAAKNILDKGIAKLA